MGKALTKMYGPLPLWAWLAIIAGAIAEFSSFFGSAGKKR